MKKKMLSLFLALALCLASLPVTAGAAVITPEQPSGDGTEASPYQIGTAAELYWFADKVNSGSTGACAQLTADITVNENVVSGSSLNGDGSAFTPWTSIGSRANAYTGTFDGGGHTISGMYQVVTNIISPTTPGTGEEGEEEKDSGDACAGLFGTIAGGTVKNLTVADSYLSATGGATAQAGGICGKVDINMASGITAPVTVTIENCTVTGTVTTASTTSGEAFAGGVCGKVDINIGTSITAPVPVTIENCAVPGAVTAKATTSGTAYAGGVCGKVDIYSGGLATLTVTIRNCAVPGAVTAKATTSGTAIAGGVCGENWIQSDLGTAAIESCSSTGTVSGKGKNACVGGICGHNYGTFHSSDNGSGNAAIIRCSSEAKVSVTPTDTDTGTETCAGGVCGKIEGRYSYVMDCKFEGEVSGTGYVGGVCGWLFGTNESGEGTFIANCSNAGTVSGTGSVGGVCGFGNGDSIFNCFNTGTVSGAGSVGGVCGANDGYDGCLVRNCFNTGNVSGTGNSDNVGGVCGQGGGLNPYSMIGAKDCGWLEGTADKGLGSSVEEGIEDKTSLITAEELQSGEVALRMNRWEGSYSTGPNDEDPNQLNGKVWAVGQNGWPELRFAEKDLVIITVHGTEKVYYGTKNEPASHLPLPDEGQYFTAAEEYVDPQTYEFNEDTTLYIHNNIVKITLQYGNGEADTVSYVLQGNSFTLPDAPTWDGHSFQCWSDGQNTYAPGMNVGALHTAMTYTAQWTEASTGGGGGGSPTVSQQALSQITAAKEGDTVVIDLTSGDTLLEKEVFQALAGRNVTLVLHLDDEVEWTIYGKNISQTAALTDLDMGVAMDTSTIPVDVLNLVTGEKSTVQLSLAHDGEFGFTLTLTAFLGVKNKGLWANLYHYNEAAGKMAFQTSAQVDASGRAALKFSHASEYAIVLDEKSHALPFTDVKEGAWYYDAVHGVYYRGIMTGTSATTFAPNTTLSRAMVAQILYNLEGKPAVTGESTFTDAGGHWAANAIAWAKETGVVAGYEGNIFKPEKAVTREELAQMLYNYAQYKKITLPALGDLSKFPDGDKVSSWARTAMSWANGLGVINGYEDSTLRPGGSTTRAEAASMIMGLATKLVK